MRSSVRSTAHRSASMLNCSTRAPAGRLLPRRTQGPLVSIRAASSSSEAQLANGSSSNVAAPAAAVPAASAAQPAARPASPAASRLGSSSGSSSSAARPLVPALDVNELLQTLLADAGDDPAANTLIGQAIPTDGGPARLFCPLLARQPSQPAADTLPMLYYMPGIDMTGLAAFRQFPSLAHAFDLRCLVVSPEDRMPFDQLVEHVAAQIRQEVTSYGAGRPVYLLGESFGGTLCLALAAKLGNFVDRLVLVNPATSFTDSPWPALGPLLTALPPDVYKLLPFLLAPLMTNPVAMAANSVNASAGPVQQASDMAYALLGLLPQLGALRLALPADTLAWRLQLLKQGADWVDARSSQVRQRVLVIAGDRDFLIPSEAEAKRLARALPRARARVLAGRSHALLQEAGVDLVEVLKDEGFYITSRQLSNGSTSTSGAGGGAAFGRAEPIPMPTQRELELDTQEGPFQLLRRVTSPVFYSTDRQGLVQRGLGGIPSQRPLLLVGNHQLFAADMYAMVEQFLSERNVLVRGLAHPVTFGLANSLSGGDAGDTRAGASTSSSSMPFSLPFGGQQSQGRRSGDRGGAAFSGFLSTYGAVPVNGKNMYALLQNGEAVLLYPGGAREAFKGRGENYQLFWPERSEFVRMAAKFGATIVPFAAIGADEAAERPLDVKDLARLPFVGDWLRNGQSRLPAARTGVNATSGDDFEFAAPLLAPAPPQRFYYVFRQPIDTTPELAADKEACDVLYKHVKAEVEDGLGYLLRKRQADPYLDLLPRLLYEGSSGWKRQAPSFEP